MWVYLCNFKVRGPRGEGSFFNVNFRDHNKGKRHAIAIYSLIDYEFPI
jgi:hypothetical protein